jgi:hypothetical protein
MERRKTERERERRHTHTERRHTQREDTHTHTERERDTQRGRETVKISVVHCEIQTVTVYIGGAIALRNYLGYIGYITRVYHSRAQAKPLDFQR